ncbi:MAG TPA: hypothetical protein VKP30_30425, partial [Polyangiaceae bacterium]|nr:hypothetical protein [Polyangiaceae bacterium]
VLEGQLLEDGFNVGPKLYFAKLINGERNPSTSSVAPVRSREPVSARVLAGGVCRATGRS